MSADRVDVVGRGDLGGLRDQLGRRRLANQRGRGLHGRYRSLANAEVHQPGIGAAAGRVEDDYRRDADHRIVAWPALATSSKAQPLRAGMGGMAISTSSSSGARSVANRPW